VPKADLSRSLASPSALSDRPIIENTARLGESVLSISKATVQWFQSKRKMRV